MTVCHYSSAGTEGEYKIQRDLGERGSSCWWDKFHSVHLWHSSSTEVSEISCNCNW